jgi:hypothetical protein
MDRGVSCPAPDTLAADDEQARERFASAWKERSRSYLGMGVDVAGRAGE